MDDEKGRKDNDKKKIKVDVKAVEFYNQFVISFITEISNSVPSLDSGKTSSTVFVKERKVCQKPHVGETC